MNALPADNPISRFWQGLTSYVPRYQLRCVLERLHAEHGPSCDEKPGVILLVDVSGFTALTERFAVLGSEGAEQLSGVLNRYFGRVTDIITAEGGDIIAFAGDSALAMWPCEEADLAANILRASQAALNIQSELDRFDAGAGNVLRQRAGIGCGDLQLMELGGAAGRWQFVVIGDPIAQAATANHEAAPGEVLLAPNAANLVSGRAYGLTLPSGSLKVVRVAGPTTIGIPDDAPLTDIGPEAISALAGSVLPVVSNRLGAGQEQWIAEFRTLSMMFLNLGNTDIKKATAVNELHGALCCIQGILRNFEGTLYQCLMDDKGLTAVCAFGLPPFAHEDDPRRAVEAALTLRDELARCGANVSAGISTGAVFCGVYGNDRRRQYTTLGNSMNFAARLMQAASSDVLCDEPTYRAAVSASAIHFDSKGKIQVKGRSVPVEVFGPFRRTAAVEASAASSTGPIQGRDAECAVFARLLSALVESGESSTLIVKGEPGIGKTRLLEHFAQHTSTTTEQNKQPVSCCRGVGDAIRQSVAYHPWKATFQHALGLTGISESIQREQLTSKLSDYPELLPLAPLLKPILSLDIPETSVSAALEGQARAESTEHLLVKLLQADAASRRLVLLLDNAQWFDSASWRLVLLVSQQLQGSLMILSMRQVSDPPPEFAALLAHPSTQQIDLGALELDSALKVVCQRLRVNRLPPEVARCIGDRAKGHPLFSEQLGYALRDAGLIQISDGRCQVPESATGAAFDAALSTLRFPSTVEGVITSRLDRLKPDVQLTLKVASVFGQNFSSRALREVHPVVADRSQVGAHLEQATELDLIRPLEPGSDGFAFRQAVTQDVAYHSVPFAQRRQIHRAIGEWLELEFHSELPSQYPLLAYHWRRAEEPRKAIQYCSEAGSQALRNHANQEAVRFLSEALEVYEKQGERNDEKRAEWELQLGRAYVNWSKYVEGRAHLEGGLKLQGHGIPAGNAATTFALIGQVARQCLHRSLPSRYLGLRQSRRETLLKSARDFEALTEVYFLQNEPLPCLHAVFRSLNLAELAGASPELARGYSSVGNLLGFMTLHGAAGAYFERAERIFSQISDPSAHAWVLVARAGYLVGLGQWDPAATLLHEAILTSDRLGNRRRGDDARIVLLCLLLVEGKFRESLALAALLYTSAKQRLDIRIQGETLYGRALSLLALDRQQEMASCLEELESLSTVQARTGGQYQRLYVDSLYAVLHLSQGDFLPARQAVDRAIHGVKGRNFPNGILVHSTITEVCLRLWQAAEEGGRNGASLKGFDADDLRRTARQSIKALQSYSRIFPIGKPLLYLRQGQFELINGQTKAALQAWEKSLQAAIKLKAVYYEGLAHVELANHTDSRDPAKAPHFHRASEILASLGATRDLARLSTGRRLAVV